MNPLLVFGLGCNAVGILKLFLAAFGWHAADPAIDQILNVCAGASVGVGTAVITTAPTSK
jgi:hypothetical protein